jgi:hypothetical protein
LLVIRTAAIVWTPIAVFPELGVTGFVATPRHVDTGGGEVQAHTFMVRFTATIVRTRVARFVEGAVAVAAVAYAVAQSAVAFAYKSHVAGAVVGTGGAAFTIADFTAAVATGFRNATGSIALSPTLLVFCAATIFGATITGLQVDEAAFTVSTALAAIPWAGQAVLEGAGVAGCVSAGFRDAGGHTTLFPTGFIGLAGAVEFTISTCF